METYFEHLKDSEVNALSYQRYCPSLANYNNVQLKSFLIVQQQLNRREDAGLKNGNSIRPSPEQWLHKFYSSKDNMLVMSIMESYFNSQTVTNN